jgi:hypothetical protein
MNSNDNHSLYWNWADGSNPKKYKYGVMFGFKGNNDCGIVDKTGKITGALPCLSKLNSYICECRSKKCTEPY